MKTFFRLLSLVTALVFLPSCGVRLTHGGESEMISFIRETSAKETHSFVVLGDSIGAHFGVSDGDSYEYKLRDKLTRDGEKWVSRNFAVSGATSGDLVTTLLESVKDTAKREVLSRADFFCISIGGNNIRRDLASHGFDGIEKGDLSSLPLVAESLKRAAEDLCVDFLSDLEVAVKTLRSVNPDAKIIVQNIHNIAHDVTGEISFLGYGTTVSALVEPIFAPIIRTIEENATPLGYTVADTYRAFEERPDEKLLRPEMLHPNEAGHTVIADVLYRTYRALVPKSL